MKNKFIKINLILLILLFVGCSKNNSSSKSKEEKITTKTEEKVEKNNFVSYNGKLKLDGTNLVNQYGEKIQLKGISSHGIQWYGNYINENIIKSLKEDYNSNVFRIAMYTSEGGYLENKQLATKVEEYVDMVIKQDMYVIIDWHILSDNNPSTHTNEAVEFFDKMSKKYADTPNVIYEICNEPNGDITWDKDIKPYADKVIEAIRKNSNDSIIIVGTGTWSQDILDPINNKIEDEKVMYACHFYAGTHTDWLRDRVKQALDAGLPIFISEWGTSSADGSGGVYKEESLKWINFMKENNISWCNWSLSDKNESSALLKPGTSIDKITDSDLSESGKIVMEALK